MERVIVLVIAVILTALRVGGVTNDFFKDIAHFFVGGLFYASYIHCTVSNWKEWKFKLGIALFLTFAVEVPMALIHHFLLKH